jgi:type IV pilus assembly protein PilM
MYCSALVLHALMQRKCVKIYAMNLPWLQGFIDDIGGLFISPRVLGIDIGTVSMKVVELSKKRDILTLENYGILETREYLNRGNAAIQTSSLKISDREAVPLLKKLIEEVKPRTRNCIASIPSFAAFFVTIDMPAIPDAEVGKAIQFQARQFIPVPITEVSLEWSKVSEFQNERGQAQHRYFLTAIPNATVKRYTEIFKAAGLRLVSLEIETAAVVRALIGNNNPITLIMDIGGQSTEFIVVEQGNIRRVTQSDYAGSTLTQALSRTLDISSKRAEELKRRKGLLGSGGEYELSTSLLPFLDVIIQECDRAKRDYERVSGKEIAEIMVVGGGANLKGLEAYLKNQMHVSVRVPDALWRFKRPVEAEPMLAQLNRELATAAGLALRRF